MRKLVYCGTGIVDFNRTRTFRVKVTVYIYIQYTQRGIVLWYSRSRSTTHHVTRLYSPLVEIPSDLRLSINKAR